MDIYWIERGETKQRRGPLPVVEIVSMLERGDLTPEVKGWHRGCEKWIALKDLPMLESYFEKKAREEEQLIQMLNEGDDPAEASLPIDPANVRVFVTPPVGMRFWARLFDSVLYLLIYFALVRAFTDEFRVSYFYCWLWLPMAFIEACLLAWWGTTPGKFLMGIQVRYCKGYKLNFSRALRRSLSVLFFGLGMMATPLTPLFAVFSWWYIKKNGIALWDRRIGSVEEMKNGGKNMIPGIFWRTLLLVFLLFVMFDAMSKLMEVWLPELERVVRQAGM